MQQSEIYHRLTKIFRDNFNDESITLSSQTTAHDIAGWDSTAHVNLVVAIEEAFHIKLRTAELEALKDVGEMALLISKKAS